MGLLDQYNPNPDSGFNEALLAAAQALLTPRHQGGGLGAAFGAFPRQMGLAQEQARRNKALGMQEQQFDLQVSELERKRQADEFKRTQIAQLMQDPKIASNPAALWLAQAGQVDKALERAYPDVKPSWQTWHDNRGQQQQGWVAPGQDPVAVGGPKPIDPNQFLIPDGQGGFRKNDQYIAARGDVAARGAASINNYPPNELGLKPKDQFDMEDKLRQDYTNDTKTDAKVMGDSSRIISLVQSASPLKDQAAIYSFAKMLDPEGAVREADYAAIAASVGGVDYIRSIVNRAITGERLTDRQRRDMETVASGFAETAARRIEAANQRYSRTAQQYTLDPQKIVRPVDKPPKPAARPPASSGATGGWSIREIP